MKERLADKCGHRAGTISLSLCCLLCGHAVKERLADKCGHRAGTISLSRCCLLCGHAVKERLGDKCGHARSRQHQPEPMLPALWSCCKGEAR